MKRIMDIRTGRVRKVGMVISALLLAPLLLPMQISAASSPGLGLAGSFVILSNTYTNTVGGTTLTGDLGYTTGPAMAPTVNGNTHISDTTYNQAGIDQGTALTALNNQACTFTFDPGAVDLASNSDFPTSTYTPGVYCITGAASIGGGGTVTLNGAGSYIFRMDGALTTSADSLVVMSNGASACDVWWTPTAATTLGANSTFAGTDIDASGITIGSNVTWTGRALAFGGTVSTDADTLSVGSCFTPDGGGTDGGGTDGGTVPGLPNTGAGEQSEGLVATWIVTGVVFTLTAILLTRRKMISTQLSRKS